MNNTNELIFVNNILTMKVTIRRAAKQLGLRRDDLISRIKFMLQNDEENLKKLNLIIIINKILFDNMNFKEAARELKLTEKELDRNILKMLENSQNKKQKYEEYKKSLKGK